MTIINEAIFKNRVRQGMLPGPETSKRDYPALMSQQLLARCAVEAVLAGGYTKCEDPETQPEPQLPVAVLQAESRKARRRFLLWLGIFILAGLVGILTSRLPGHAVQAKPAERTELVDVRAVAAGEWDPAVGQAVEAGGKAGDTAKNTAFSPVRQSAEAAKTAAPVNSMDERSATGAPAVSAASDTSKTVVTLKPVVAAPAPVAASAFAIGKEIYQAAPPAPAPKPETRLAAAILNKITRPAPAPGLIAATPDDRPLRQPAASASDSSAGAPLEEVLYEGEPVQAEPVAPAPAPAREKVSVSRRRAAAPSGKSASGRAQAPARFRVEGIFWDKTRPMAILNGDIVEPGADVDGYTVKEIKPGLIILANGSSRLELRP